jgi:flagellar motility protein MotE (MotC chaperone)
MKRILQSGWMAALLGTLLFLGTMALSWTSISLPTPKPPTETGPTPRSASLTENASFVELDQLIADLQQQKAALAEREKQLREWEDRLQSEIAEINQITQRVYQAQRLIEGLLLNVETNEPPNLRRLAKTYAAMAPETAAGILRQLEDVAIAKILVFMKEEEMARLLEAFSQLGAPEAKRAAEISERLRLAAVRGTAERSKS